MLTALAGAARLFCAPAAYASGCPSTASAITGDDGGGWFNAPPANYQYNSGFETTDAENYNTTDTGQVYFSPIHPTTTAPGSLFAFGDWNSIVDADVTNAQIMQVINNGLVDDDPANARAGDQSIRVTGSNIGAQSAGYGNEFAFDAAGQMVSLTVDMRVTGPENANTGLWGLALFSAPDADDNVNSFGGLGFSNGSFYLSQDGQTTDGAAITGVSADYDEWVTLGVDFNFATRTYNASVNGNKVATSVAFNPTATGTTIGIGAFGQGFSEGTGEDANFDNYSVTITNVSSAVVPEANTGLLVTLGAALATGGLAVTRRRTVKGIFA